MTEETESKWIDATKELPPTGVEVIVFVAPTIGRPKGRVTALCRLHRFSEDPDWWWDNSYGRGNYHASHTVSHWMYFPVPPPYSDEFTDIKEDGDR